ncbi:hypothetical protein OIO90_004113 [Microbotryomycetes sp. JL221]|nr:hypothetical protein OIO90_004113 [Microbotryomycetes sp. JL221]
MKTEAYVLQGKDAPFEWKSIELDEPQPNELLIQVIACGVCHTELSVQNGAFPSPFPALTGHEGAGKVIKVGSKVTRAQIGDQVLLSFSSCQECGLCDSGHPAACATWADWNFGRLRNTDVGNKAAAKGQDGKDIYGHFFGQSSLGRHALVVESSVVKVPQGIDVKTLAPLGCGLQTGAGGVMNVLKPTKDDTVLITGLGAVGMGAMFAAAALNVERIIVVDIVESRLELAKQLGATHAINGKTQDVVAEVKKISKHGIGATKVLEATGVVAVLKTAYEATANRGHVVSCGTPGPGNNVPIDIFTNVVTSRTYSGCSEGDSNPPEFIPKLIKLFEQGKFPIDKISKQFNYKDLDKAIHAMHTGETIKPIMIFEE